MTILSDKHIKEYLKSGKFKEDKEEINEDEEEELSFDLANAEIERISGNYHPNSSPNDDSLFSHADILGFAIANIFSVLFAVYNMIINPFGFPIIPYLIANFIFTGLLSIEGVRWLLLYLAVIAGIIVFLSLVFGFMIFGLLYYLIITEIINANIANPLACAAFNLSYLVIFIRIILVFVQDPLLKQFEKLKSFLSPV